MRVSVLLRIYKHGARSPMIRPLITISNQLLVRDELIIDPNQPFSAADCARTSPLSRLSIHQFSIGVLLTE